MTSGPCAPAPTWLGRARVELASCGSTNDEALQRARAGAPHGTIVIAHAQTAGRGRDGRAWSSPPGAGLYLSAIVRPPVALAALPPMTLAIGVGLCDAIRRFAPAAALKWPNDVLVGGRKLAGVLVETQSQGARLEAAIVGVGVNLTGAPPPELHAITLAEASAGSPRPYAPGDRGALIDAVCAELAAWIDRFVADGAAGVTAAWQARMAPGLRARATIGGADVTGELVGIAGDGALRLRDAAGRVHEVRAGDVRVLRPPGSA